MKISLALREAYVGIVRFIWWIKDEVLWFDSSSFKYSLFENHDPSQIIILYFDNTWKKIKNKIYKIIIKNKNKW